MIGLAYASFFFVLFAGWPMLAFAHYRFRRKFPVARSLFLTILPGLGTVFVVLIFSEGGLVPRGAAPWVNTLAVGCNLLWLGTPYLILALWAVRVCRRGPRNPPPTVRALPVTR